MLGARALALSVVVWALPMGGALAQSQYQGYPVSPRGLGMGGATTALAAEAGAIYYNPAAVAVSSSERFVNASVSGSIYGLAGGSLRGQFGGGGRDFRYMTFQIVPSNFSVGLHGIKLGKLKISRRWGFGLSVLAPYSFKFNSVAADAGSGSLVLRQTTDLTYTAYLGVGYQILPRLFFGVALVGLYRNFELRTVVNRDPKDGTLIAASGEQSMTTFGESLAFGLRGAPIEKLWLGVALHLPTHHLLSWQSTQRDRLALYTDATGLVTLNHQRSLDARFRLPLRINVGIAWEVAQRWAVTVTANFWMPQTYTAAIDRDTKEVVLVNRYRFVANVALGIERWVGTIALRAGFFTDRSPIAAPTFDSGIGDKIDLYGGTLSVGFPTRGGYSEVGFIGAGGPASSVGYDLIGATFTTSIVTGYQWRAMIGYSTSLGY